MFSSPALDLDLHWPVLFTCKLALPSATRVHKPRFAAGQTLSGYSPSVYPEMEMVHNTTAFLAAKLHSRTPIALDYIRMCITMPLHERCMFLPAV